MTAGVYDLYIEAEAGFEQDFLWEGDDGLPVSLVGYTAEMMFRVNYADNTPVLTLSDGGNGIELGGAGGTIVIKLTHIQTGALSVGNYVYDILMTPPTGEPIRFLQGAAKVSPAVTKP
jgi:hypothetical protein